MEEYRKKFNRPLAPPTTWEAFAELAAFFSQRDRKPSLPRPDARQLEDTFARVAACYDRPVRTGEAQDNSDSLAFQFRLDTGKTRLETQGFTEAAKWLVTLKSSVPANGGTDPATELDEDRAVLAIATLADLMRLKSEGKAAGRYGLAALPGTKSFVNPATGTLVVVPSNYVPHHSGGWLGVVRRGCQNPDAAFALLAELTGPARSQQIIAAGGFAPTREAHLEQDRIVMWLGYGFDESRTRALQDILRANIGKSVRNPTYGLRTPDEAVLRRELEVELAKIAAGTVAPELGLKRAAEAWDRERKETPGAKSLEWRRRAAGLN